MPRIQTLGVAESEYDFTKQGAIAQQTRKENEQLKFFKQEKQS